MRQRCHAHSARLEQEEASTYYDTSSEIMDLLAHKSISSNVIDNVHHIFAFLHHKENLSHITLVLIFPKTFSFLSTLNSANHGHVLTRKLALLFFIAKQVLEKKTMNFRFEITNMPTIAVSTSSARPMIRLCRTFAVL
jgi:hypothetical protein